MKVDLLESSSNSAVLRDDMPSRSRVRRESAIQHCCSKRRYSSLKEAGLIARSQRERGIISRERAQVPYLCPAGEDHYHTGCSYGGKQRVIDIVWRLRIGRTLDQKDLDFAGIDIREVDFWRSESDEAIINYRRCMGLVGD